MYKNMNFTLYMEVDDENYLLFENQKRPIE